MTGPETSKRALKAIDDRIAAIDKLEDESFFVADFDYVASQYELWEACFPDVRPFYAVKCNPDRELLGCLLRLGAGFDCASIQEIRYVLNLRVPPKDIVFANPCKYSGDLDDATRLGVRRMTFDNFSELDKIKSHCPDARLLLRMHAYDKTAVVKLGDKFGASLESVPGLLQHASNLELMVDGVSFHVGSAAEDVTAFEIAIQHARAVCTVAESFGMRMGVLDIGGGFGHDRELFKLVASAIRNAIDRAEFPQGMAIISEPGRFFASGAYTLACRVHSIRTSREDPSCAISEGGRLYQNDGIYKHFMNKIVEGTIYRPFLVYSSCQRPRKPEPHNYSIWGPTCDSTDQVSEHTVLESEAIVGDWLVYPNMGAYTTSTTTAFNGFLKEGKTIYLGHRDDFWPVAPWRPLLEYLFGNHCTNVVSVLIHRVAVLYQCMF